MGMVPVLATSKPELFAHRILDHYDLKKYFAIVAGANLDNTRTKKDEVVGFAVNCICSDVKPSDIIMVGDRMHDVLGAAAHGIKCIGVTYGYGGEEELTSAGAAFIAHTPPEIGEILSKSL